MKNVHGINVVGGSLPAEIWQKFMSKAHAGVAVKDFERPAKGLIGIKLCADMPGLVANDFCTDTVFGTFAKGAGPRKICDVHQAPPNVKVPNLIGMTLEQAKTSLERAGLTYNIKDVDRAAIPAGQVASQNPAEGAEVPQGWAVDLEVSTGHAPSGKIKTPAIVGLPLGQAKAYLEDAGLKYTVVQAKVTNPEQIGKVVGQAPKAGTPIMTGATVTIKVGY